MGVKSTRAQTTYTNGIITYKAVLQGQDVEMKEYFSADSVANVFSAGPANIKLLTDANHEFFALLVDISAFAIKKAAIYSPDEIKAAMNDFPAITFLRGTETKQISGFNCTKVVVTTIRDQKTYDLWITNDIVVPPVAIPYYYKDVGGFPVQYTAFKQGETTEVIVTAASADIAPAGTFSIPPDFDKISKTDLDQMSNVH